VTLQNLNVYACLICGKYYQGRGRNSQAYLHSLQADHHVFINLHNEKVYSLPDDYEVIDPSLSDIKSLLNPTFSQTQISKIDTESKVSQSLDGNEYYPGYIGLNDIKKTDYINVVLQILSHVPPLRNFFIFEDNYRDCKNILVQRFGELIRKIYNPKNFKAQVSPHELLQAVSTISSKKFGPGIKGDPVDFIQFLLNSLHFSLCGSKKSSVIYKTFQGQVEVTTYKKNEIASVNGSTNNQVLLGEEGVRQLHPFLFLTLDLPPTPLFQDEQEKNIIPQMPIFDLLAKFNGKTVTNLVSGERKTFIVTKLPPYLVVHIKRFTKNNFFQEKNPTIVNFPLKNLDLKDYVVVRASGSTKYNLISNIVHEGEPSKGSFKAHVLQKATDHWYEMQDLIVKQIMPQLIALSESYVALFERQT